MSHKRRLGTLEHLTKRTCRLTSEEIRAMTDEELEQHLQEWERADPSGYAAVKAMSDAELEEQLKRRGAL